MPSNKWGGGMRLDLQLKGGEELARKLRAIGAGAEAKLLEATRAGAEVAFDPIKRDAPGDGVIMVQSEKPNLTETKAYEIGPDKEHWYYQFFETGVQPFEINMIKRRTARSAIDKKASQRKGKATKMRGRRVQGDAKVLVFPGSDGGTVFAKRVRRGGMAARPFMRANFMERSGAVIGAFREVIEKHVIWPSVD